MFCFFTHAGTKLQIILPAAIKVLFKPDKGVVFAYGRVRHSPDPCFRFLPVGGCFCNRLFRKSRHQTARENIHEQLRVYS